jgi:hypothetical protein
MTPTVPFSAGTSLVFFLLMHVDHLFSRFIEVIGIGVKNIDLIQHIKDKGYEVGINFISSQPRLSGKEKAPVYYNLYTPPSTQLYPEIIFFIISSSLSVTERIKVEAIKNKYLGSKQPLFIAVVLNSAYLSKCDSDLLRGTFDVYLTTKLDSTSEVIKVDMIRLITSFHDLTLPGWAGIDFKEVKTGLRDKGQGVLVYKDIQFEDLQEDLSFLPFKRSSFWVPKTGLAHTIYLNMACNDGSLKVWKQLDGFFSGIEETSEVLLNLPLKTLNNFKQTNYPCTMLLTGYT